VHVAVDDGDNPEQVRTLRAKAGDAATLTSMQCMPSFASFRRFQQ
jgi:hypothetical protein